MSEKYAISDTHFGHEKIIGYCKRPWSTSLEMDEAMIWTWNSRVKSQDDVYHHGDFGLAEEKYLLNVRNRLNGHIFLIRGNHDKPERIKNLRFVNVYDYHELKASKLIIMSHYPFRTWKNAIHGSLHTFGHVHNTMSGIGRSIDVGVDTPLAQYGPISIDQIVHTLSNQQVIQTI